MIAYVMSRQAATVRVARVVHANASAFARHGISPRRVQNERFPNRIRHSRVRSLQSVKNAQRTR